jgi:lipopolysaccharide transport system permease protein
MATGVSERPAAASAAPTGTLPYRRQTIREAVGEAWAARALVRPLGARVVRKTYAKTKLGASWLVIRPVVDTGGKALLFGSVLGIVGAPNGVPYFLFLLVGMQAWRLFDQTLFWATRGFDRYAKLTRSFAFPLLLVPISASAFAWVEFLIYGLILVLTFLLFVVVDGELYLQLGPELLLAPLGLLLALGLALGISLWLSLLNARWRDVRLALRFVLEVWLYVTPVIYPLTLLPAGFQTLAQVNPMAPVVEMVKEGLLDAGHVTALGVAWSVAATIAALASGLWFFSRNAARFNTPLPLDDDDDDETF